MNYEALQLALAETLSDRDTRNAVEDALSDGDECEAARLIVNALNRISTKPAHLAPAHSPDPQPQSQTRAGVPLDTLADLARLTP